MVTFLALWETMRDQGDSPLKASGEDTPAMHAVRVGLGLRGGSSDRTFWDDFLSVCRDGDGVAELLGVRPDQVAGWATRVSELVDRVRREDDNQDSTQKRVMPTGDLPF